MLRGRLLAPILVALVSAPGFLLGHKLRQGNYAVALLLIPMMLAVVFVASLIMRQGE